MTLPGRTIVLRPLNPATDYAPLYDLLAGRVTTWRNLGRAFPPEQLPSILWEHTHTLLVVAVKDAPDVCLGLVSLISADLANQTADLTIAIHPAAPETAGGEAAVLFLRHQFATSSFRTIYAETTDLTLPWLRHPEGAPGSGLPGTTVEGCRRGAVLIGGVPHDLVTLAMHREIFLEETERVHRFAIGDVIPRSSPRPEWRTFLDQLVEQFPELQARDLTGGTLLLEDLGVDSLLLVELVAWVEDHFGLLLDDERLLLVKTVQQLYELVAEDAPVLAR